MVANRQKPKHIPLRRCVACRRSREQEGLERFYRDASGQWQHDPKRKAGGRGAWVCADTPTCQQQKALGRFFRAQAKDIAKTLQTSMQAANQADRNGGLHG